MVTDYKKFYANNLKRYQGLKLRTRKDFINWNEKQGDDHRLPVPVYDKNEHNPDNVVFKSPRDLVEYVKRVPGWHSCLDDSSGEAGPDTWSWNFNVEQAIRLFDDGWSDGFEAVKYPMEEAALAAMLAMMKDTTFGRDLHGCDVDVGAFLRGEPECMMEFQDEVRQVLHLDVEVDYYLSAAMPPDEMMHRGCVIAAAVMALRRLGVFVTLHTSMFTGYNAMRGKTITQSEVQCHINLMNQDLTENLTETLMVLAHPAFYRKIFFHGLAASTGCLSGSLGYNWRDTKAFDLRAGSGHVVIPGHFYQSGGQDDSGIDWPNAWSSPKAAETLVRVLFKCAGPGNYAR